MPLPARLTRLLTSSHPPTETRFRPATRYWAILLINALFWQPVIVLAEGIKVAPGSGNTQLDRAGNGVPVINIATPNGKGVSHNTFSDYNVDKNGLILNNGRDKFVDTQLSGKILGNPNLRDRAAQLIINEVNSGNPSRLQGYTEVAGQRASVVVANPFGITCNGCGFINTPQVTLSTGKPVFKDGDLDHFAVDQGQVTIEGLGLDAEEVDRFDIITRAAKLNAEIHANELNIVTGANDVDADSLATTRRAGTGEVPKLAIDSSALGGMYANTIHLVANESGVGVKVAGNMAASGGDLRIDANSQLVVANASSTGQIVAKAQSITLDGDVHAHQAANVQARDNLAVTGTLTSAGDIQAKAGQRLTNSGLIVAGIEDNTRHAGRNLNLEAGQLDNQNILDATQQLGIHASQVTNTGDVVAQTVKVNTSQRVTNHGLLEGDNVSLTSGTITNQGQDARIAGSRSLSLDSDGLANSGTIQYAKDQDVDLDLASFDNSGGTLVLDGGDLTGNAGVFVNQGGTLGANVIDLEATSVDNSAGGQIEARELTLNATGTINNAQGVMLADNALTLDAASVGNAQGTLSGNTVDITTTHDLSNQKGLISAENGPLTLNVGGLLNNVAGTVQSPQSNLTITTASLDNRDGELLAEHTLTAHVSGKVDNRANGGEGGFINASHVDLTAGELDNSDSLISAARDVTLDVAGRLTNTRGHAQAGQVLTLDAGSVGNAQGTLSGNTVDITARHDLGNQKGLISAENGRLALNAGGTVSNVAGTVQSRQGDLQLTADEVDSRDGELLAQGLVKVTASGVIDNSTQQQDAPSTQAREDAPSGGVISGQQVTLKAAQLSNAEGLVEGERVDLTLARLDNTSGTISAERDLALTMGEWVHNVGGRLQTLDGDLTLKGTGTSSQRPSKPIIDNTQGVMVARYLNLYQLDSVTNRQGQIVGDRVHLQAASLNNQQGTIAAGGQQTDDTLTLTLGGALSNTGGTLQAMQDTTLIAGSLGNTGGDISGRDVHLTIRGDIDNATYKNAGGVISAERHLTANVGGQLTNTQGILQAVQGDTTLTADSLDNANGRILAQQALDVTSDAALINAAGTLLAMRGDMDLTASSLDNRNGLLVAGQVDDNGQLTTTQNLSVQLGNGTLDNRQRGQIIGDEVTLRLARLNNGDEHTAADQGGVIGADSALNLYLSEWLRNRQGSLQVVDGTLALHGAGTQVDNTQGFIRAKHLALGDADKPLGDITNAGGTLAADSVTLNAANLDNTQQGLIIAEKNDLTLHLSGALHNQGGKLQSDGNASLTADGIDNRSGGVILADNITLNAVRLLNQQGAILGEGQDSTLTLSGTSASTPGTDPGTDSAVLENAGGTIDIKGGNLIINATAGHIDNRGGWLGADALALHAKGLNNGPSSDGQKGQVVATRGDLQLHVDAIENQGGTLLAQGGFLSADFTTLRNQGGIVQGDNVRLTGQSVENDNGQIAALNGDATLTLTQKLSNLGSKILALGKLFIGTSPDRPEGEPGQATPVIDNRQGGQLAGNTVFLRAGTLDNRDGGIIEATGIDAKEALNITADNLSNSAGYINSLGGDNSQILVAGTLNNAGGAIELASHNATLDAITFNNQQGVVKHAGNGLLTLIADRLNNTDGNVTGTGSATATLDTLEEGSGLGTWQFNDALTLALQQALVLKEGDRIATPGALILKATRLDNAGELLANGNLRIDTTDKETDQRGDVTNTGRISSLGNLTLIAHDLTNIATPGDKESGRIASGGTSTYRLSGNLDNRGRLVSVGDLDILAANLYNRGTLGSQNALTITVTDCIQNGQKDCNGQNALNEANNALMFAGGDMNLYASRLMNAYSDIYAMGDLTFAKNADGERADSLENRSGNIEAEGNMTLLAENILNTRDVLTVEEQPGDGQTMEVEKALVRGYDIKHGTQNCDGYGGSPCKVPNEERDKYHYTVTVTEQRESKITDDSDQGVIAAGGNLLMEGEDITNDSSSMLANGNVTIIADKTFTNKSAQNTRTEQTTTYEFDLSKYSLEWENQASNGWEPVVVPNEKVAEFDREVADWMAKGGVDENGEALPLPKRLNDGNKTPDTPPVVTVLDGGAHAIVQAGKKVTIKAGERIQNGEINENTLSQINGQLGDTSTGGPVSDVTLTLNRRTKTAEAIEANNTTSVERSSVDKDDRLAAAGLDSTTAQVDTANGADPTAPQGSSMQAAGDLQAPDYREVAFERVSPTEQGGFRLPEGEFGLFVQSPEANSHYLIETNPEFTTLDGILGSDYLLDKLGYTDDSAYRLLGDGRYESRLIRDSVLNATGSRYLEAGLDDDYAQYRYLMDNAIAAQEALNLSIGVGLTPAQTAALTHDIVWMEEQVINGQKVLAPVLYLAKLDERNVRGGSIIQGHDVEMITGGDLVNVGTIRADNDLSIDSGGSILQGGLIDAGNQLDLHARDDIRNALAGEIRGGDVSLRTDLGDIINDRLAVAGGVARDYRTYLDQGGLINARDSLTLDAGRDVINRADLISGGDARISAGRDVRFEAVADVTHRQTGEGINAVYRDTTVQHGSQLISGGDTSVVAGKDIAITASSVESGGSLDMAAGNDIVLDAAQNSDAVDARRHYSEHIEQQGTTLAAGADATLRAGNDVTAIAAKVDAGGDIAVAAGNDITLASAANSSDEASATARKKRVDSHTRQQGTKLTAGGDASLEAGHDVAIVASQVAANDSAYVYAGNDVTLAAANDEDYTLDKKHSSGGGFFGSQKTKRDEVSETRAVSSEITTANGDLVIASGGDQTYQGARLDSGDDLILNSGDEIHFANASDLITESHTKDKSSFAWQSAKGEGSTVESLRQSQLEAKGERIIQAAQGITVDLPQNGEITQQSVSQTIDALVQADPELAWLKDMEARGDVDWRQVKAMRDSWDYDHAGLSGAAQLVIAIVVTYFTAGAASGAVAAAASSAGASTAAGAAWAAGAAGTGAGIGWANAAATAAITGIASNGAVSTINNKGNLGHALDDTFSSDAVRGYAVAGITAGLTNGLYGDWTNTQVGLPTAVEGTQAVNAASGLSTWQGVGQFTANQVLQNSTSALLDRALGGDADLGDALQNSLANAFAAAGFNAIGDFTQGNANFQEGSLSKAALHAVMGGLAAEATGGDFKTGALAAGINELLVDKLANEYAGMSPDKKAGLLVMNSQIIGVLAAAATGGANDTDNLQTGAQVAANATQYNYLRHDQVDAYAKELEGCAERGDCADIRKTYVDKSLQQQQELVALCAAGADACQTIRSQLLADEGAFYSSLERLDQVAVGEASRDPIFARMQYIDAVAAGAEEEVVQDLMAHAGLDREEASYLKDVAVATVAASTSLLGRGGATQAANVATQRDVAGYFQQNRKFWTQEPIQFSGNKVYQRNDLIDPNRVDLKSGKTNLELMQAGRAPFGPDGRPINLHHLTQKQDGSIVEVTQTLHSSNHGTLHMPNTVPSGINRAEFNAWRRNYWKNRANDF
ncbi:DUF637 domain-containing protein [Halomonas binhaiensis]|uniref:DUF637 domain-containing protein n=1 Tax=Halomonas binhaiensis TaxID=2562282 RepID=A0A5C1NIW3_9GAMM|nr:DUF637 domain-containing protein [Halomonas binhaiensis]QEM83266.1 DUF637 domain-containing protein [Halomonas binhaiensis]